MGILQTIKTADTIVSVTEVIMDKAVPKLLPLAKEFANRMFILAEKYSKIVEFAMMIDKAADILGDILFVLGIQSDHADVLGIKAVQADLSMEEFDSIEDYIAYLRNEIEIDKEKFDRLSEEERIACTVLGLAIEASCIGEKLGIDISADVVEMFAKIAQIGKVVLGSKEIIYLINTLRNEGIIELSDILDWAKGEGTSDRLRTGEALDKAFEILYPNESREILNEILCEMRGKVQ